MTQLTLGNVVMMAVGATLVYLAVAKKYEPFLLIGIGFACIVANVPGSDLTEPGGLFYYAYQGVALLIIPPLIFLGVGAMTDFGPMIANPEPRDSWRGAHLGIFVALILAKMIGFTINEAGAIGIIGGADGPMAIFVTVKLAPHLLAADLGGRLLLHGADADDPAAGDEAADHQGGAEDQDEADCARSAGWRRSSSPVVIAIIVNLFFPPVAPLITMLMLGNLLREVADRRSPGEDRGGDADERHHHHSRPWRSARPWRPRPSSRARRWRSSASA